MSEDEIAIRELINRQFKCLSWSPGNAADWDGFAHDFVAGAQLFPAARPVRAQSIDAFTERMQGLSQSSLPNLEERCLGVHVQVFGNVAVAMAVCELTESEGSPSCNVEAILLVKQDNRWLIAAQAWDTAPSIDAIPTNLLSSSSQ